MRCCTARFPLVQPNAVHTPEIALVHMSRPKRKMVVKPKGASKALHLFAEHPCALVEALELALLGHFLVASAAEQNPLQGHCRRVTELAVPKQCLERVLLDD